jgi:hypothetical protein
MPLKWFGRLKAIIAIGALAILYILLQKSC